MKDKNKEQPENLYNAAEDKTGNLNPVGNHEKAEHPVISWQASEFVMHQKPAWWYIAFVGITLALGLVFLVVFKDIVAAIAIVIVFGLTLKLAMREPRTLPYTIGNDSVSIGERKFPYEAFRTFSIIKDGGLDSILLHPLQRFSLSIIIYFDPKDTEAIVSALSFHLPHEEQEMSAIDRISRTLRF